MTTQTTHDHPGTRLRAARQDRLMTQRELARKAGIALRTLYSAELGLSCRMDTKRKLLRALGIPFDQRHTIWEETK